MIPEFDVSVEKLEKGVKLLGEFEKRAMKGIKNNEVGIGLEADEFSAIHIIGMFTEIVLMVSDKDQMNHYLHLLKGDILKEIYAEAREKFGPLGEQLSKILLEKGAPCDTCPEEKKKDCTSPMKGKNIC